MKVRFSKPLPVLLAALAIAGGSAAFSASANSTESADALKLRPAIHQEMKEAMESGSYEAWATLAAETPMGQKHAEKITPENFKKLQEAHRLMEAGDKDGAKAIMDELGVKPFKMKRHAFRQDMKQLTEEQKKVLKEAMEKKDPAAVKALMEEYGIQPHHPKGILMGGVAKQLTEEQRKAVKGAMESQGPEAAKALLSSYGVKLPEPPAFAKLSAEQKTALEAARKSGDKEAVEALLKEYGIEKPHGKAFGKGRLFHRGMQDSKARAQE